jgi:BASS family bile acid:Na+ symporter
VPVRQVGSQAVLRRLAQARGVLRAERSQPAAARTAPAGGAACGGLSAVVTLPVITNLAIAYFDPADGGSLGLQFGKTLQVFAIVLIPVALGMLVRRGAIAFADRMDNPVRIAPAAVLALVIVATMVADRENIAGDLLDVGLPALLFCLISPGAGFFAPRALGVVRGQAIASAFGIGVHNGTLAIAVAISVLGSVELAVPAAVYSVLMFPAAAVFGAVITRTAKRPAEEATRV